MGGGGHLNIAGAQVKRPIDEVEEMLKGIIDEDISGGIREMKVILLEDVKSLGKKGQIVNVSDGLCAQYASAEKAGSGGDSEKSERFEASESE